MVDFLNEIRDPNNESAVPLNPSFSTSAFNVIDASRIPAQQPQTFMSLGQLSSEYATYLLLNQFGLDNNAIMGVSAFQKVFPLGTQSTSNSLTSLIPYASMLSLMSGLDNTNLLNNLQLLQAAASSMINTESQQQIQTSAATCASSVVTESPTNEANNNLNPVVKQQFLPATPSSSPIFDESLHNSISKNKLGRSYNPGRPLSMPDRERILDLYKKGYKISHIARIIGVTHSCVSKIMTRYRRTGSMCPRSALQLPRKNSSDSSPTRSSTSPFSIAESSSAFTGSSIEFSDSTYSFAVPQSSVPFNRIPSSSNPELSSVLIQKPVPIKLESIYAST